MNKLQTLKILLDKLKKYTIALIVIEVICIVLIGLSASQVKDFYSPWTILIVFCSILQIVIFSYRYNYLKDFPSTLVESIKGDLLSQTLQKDYSRISLINDSIANALISLNSQTCQLQEQAAEFGNSDNDFLDNKLCNKGIQQGLSILIDSFLKNLHNISESGQSKFTVGVYLSFYLETLIMPDSESIEKPCSGSFLLKDDLGLNNYIPSRIFENNEAKGVELEIQSWHVLIM